MTRISSVEKAVQHLARLLGTMRRLDIFTRDIHISKTDIKCCVLNWKSSLFRKKAQHLNGQ